MSRLRVSLHAFAGTGSIPLFRGDDATRGPGCRFRQRVSLRRLQEGDHGETNLSAPQSAPPARAWIPPPHAHELGTQSPGASPREGESALDRLRLGPRTSMPWGDEPLRSREAINQLFQGGTVHHGRRLLLISRHVSQGPRKVLFVASRRVGKAVRRNRAKRLMRAAYQQLVAGLTENERHLAWIARSSCADSGMREIETDMSDLLARAGLCANRATSIREGRNSQDHRG